MRGLRKHFTMGLVLLMVALTGHCGESAPSAAPAAAAGRTAHQDLRRLVEILKYVEESRGRHRARTEALLRTRARTSPVDSRKSKTERKGNEDDDEKKKLRFLIHLTDRLYFSSKCSKDVYKLYYQTRDCTIPAYFKRCARLLARLAGSPQCTEG